MRSRSLIFTTLLAAAACSSEAETVTETVSAAERGRELFLDPRASPSVYSRFSCATCHPSGDEPQVTSERIFPGAPLAGATERPLFWQGQRNDLLAAMNDCRQFFMGATSPWASDDEEAVQLYAYLDALPKSLTAPVPFTLQVDIADVPKGDVGVGEDVYRRACATCHGRAGTGEERITTAAPILPDGPLADHAMYATQTQRLVFVEKVRHGGFFGYGGTMPPFSLEALGDAELGALLAYLGLYR